MNPILFKDVKTIYENKQVKLTFKLTFIGIVFYALKAAWNYTWEAEDVGKE